MFLREIGAVRYGGLEGVTLGPLEAGLNVVYGRNEAGKSTLTSLVRHVLFGFPRGRTSERLYQPVSGDHRVGRLVFSEDGAEWTVERTEGVRGGEAVVHGPKGIESGEDFLHPSTGRSSAFLSRSCRT
jgi:uncharacterized protein YhaN